MNDSIDFQIVTESLASVLEPKPRVLDNLIPTWNIIIVMLAMLILVLNKQLFAQRFKMFSLTTKPADVDKLTREWNPIASLGGMSVAIIYIALISLLVQKIVMVFSDNHILYSGISFYLEICAFVALYLILQYLLVIFVGWLFGFEKAAMHHEIAHLTMIASLDAILAVFVFITFFYPTKIILIITAAIILIITIIRIIKTFYEVQILSKMNLLNNFLYFCTLEIIPITVAITMMCRLIATDCVL
jgi:hypothetical protein